jgi:hypothetical protein
MKTLFTVVILGFSVCMNSFAQGSIVFFNGGSSLVWDNLSSATFLKAPANLEVAVMWSANTSAIPTTVLGGAATATNGATVGSWTGILTDPNFQLAHSTTAGNPVIVSTCGGIGPLVGTYNAGIQLINGTFVGESVQVYVIGWDNSFGLDPVAAAAAGAPVGFTAPIQYLLGSASTLTGSFSANGISAFGVAVPEPSTFALAGLGAASLLIFRRRRNG